MASCSTCSAPLESDSVTCDYCGTRNNVDLQAVNAWSTGGPNQNRSCPTCEVSLETITIKVKGKEDVHVDRCPQCDGLFFDPNELQYIIKHSVQNVFQPNKKRLAALRQNIPQSRRSRHYIPCPVCKTLMNSMSYGYKSGIIVDYCRDHGFWLDSGELRHLLEWAKAGGELIEKPKIEKPGGSPPAPPAWSSHDRAPLRKDRNFIEEAGLDIAEELIEGLFKFLKR
ncbi:MAG: zf-TFIIB domain-containing protein [Verrucomicrobiota bacterium]